MSAFAGSPVEQSAFMRWTTAAELYGSWSTNRLHHFTEAAAVPCLLSLACRGLQRLHVQLRQPPALLVDPVFELGSVVDEETVQERTSVGVSRCF